MDQSRRPGNRPGTPWWYRVPHVAVVVIVYAATGILIYTLISRTPIAWAGGGLAAGLLAALVQGMAQAAHDGRRPR